MNGRYRAGRGFIMNHADRLDFVIGILAQSRFDRIGVGTTAPVALDEDRVQAQLLG